MIKGGGRGREKGREEGVAEKAASKAHQVCHEYREGNKGEKTDGHYIIRSLLHDTSIYLMEIIYEQSR